MDITSLKLVKDNNFIKSFKRSLYDGQAAHVVIKTNIRIAGHYAVICAVMLRISDESK